MLRGNRKTHVPHKIALLAPFLAAQPRLPSRAWSLVRGTSHGPEKWRQNHQFSVAQQFYNCLLSDSKIAAMIFSTVGIVSRSRVLEYGIGVSP